MQEISRKEYAAMYGPTTGDRVRLADTSLIVEVEKDYCVYGDEAKFGGGKSLRDGMGQAVPFSDEECLDMVITSALVIDSTGIYKADIGIKAGKISKKEGQFLLGVSNNISPAFFLNYVASQTLHISFNPLFLLAFLYLIIFIYAFITRPEYGEVTIPQCSDSHIKLTFQMLDESQIDYSILAKIGNAIAWIFVPQGWGNWQATVASITGLVAKENIVGTMGILYGGGDGTVYQALAGAFTTASGFSFLVFNLLCAPCFAAIGAIRREMNNPKWTWFAIGYQTIFAYLVALMIYQFGTLVTGGGFGIGTAVAIIVAIAFIYMIVRPNKYENNTLNDKRNVLSVNA